jgi:hypothetical protein
MINSWSVNTCPPYVTRYKIGQDFRSGLGMRFNAPRLPLPEMMRRHPKKLVDGYDVELWHGTGWPRKVEHTPSGLLKNPLATVETW